MYIIYSPASVAASSSLKPMANNCAAWADNDHAFEVAVVIDTEDWEVRMDDDVTRDDKGTEMEDLVLFVE